MNILTGYLGTYASPNSRGIYRFTLDSGSGSLSLPELYHEAPDCKYLSLKGPLLAAPLKQDGQAGICLIDTSGDTAVPIGEEFRETAAACYVIQDDRYVYTANYHEGSILIYERTAQGPRARLKIHSRHLHVPLRRRFGPNSVNVARYASLTGTKSPTKWNAHLTESNFQTGPRLAKQIDIAKGAGCHQILFYSHYMLVPCLLLDSVKIFDCGKDFMQVGELTFSKGTGPRHGIFSRDQKRLFLVSELSNQVFAYRAGDSGSAPDIQLEHVYPILPPDASYSEPPASAAIRLSPDERYLYVSTRFAELITVFAIDGCSLTPVQQTGCGGVHPRDFCLTPDGRFLLAVNRTEGGLVCFPVDTDSGRLLPICSRVPAPEAVSIVLENV